MKQVFVEVEFFSWSSVLTQYWAFCLIPFQFLSVYLHLNLFMVYWLLIHYLRIYCNCYTAGKPIHLQIFILASFVVLLFVHRRIFRVEIERIIFFSLWCCSLTLNNLQSTKMIVPLRHIEHAISSAQSNELIEWQTGKLFAYLTLRNSRINVTFRNRY